MCIHKEHYITSLESFTFKIIKVDGTCYSSFVVLSVEDENNNNKKKKINNPLGFFKSLETRVLKSLRQFFGTRRKKKKRKSIS